MFKKKTSKAKKKKIQLLTFNDDVYCCKLYTCSAIIHVIMILQNYFSSHR